MRNTRHPSPLPPDPITVTSGSPLPPDPIPGPEPSQARGKDDKPAGTRDPVPAPPATR